MVEQTGQLPQENASGLDGLTRAVATAATKGPPPVHLWNPPFCGDLDMRIAADGTWYYLKTPIGRPALVKLFASVLKREDGRFFLVTPVEKCGILVDDAPFNAVEMVVSHDGRLSFRTNVDDWVMVDSGHPLRFDLKPDDGAVTPYVHVRRDLWARVTRAVTYDLIARGEVRAVEGRAMFGVPSGDQFFAIQPAETLA
jgi:uncharacterized protein